MLALKHWELATQQDLEGKVHIAIGVVEIVCGLSETVVSKPDVMARLGGSRRNDIAGFVTDFGSNRPDSKPQDRC
jgi:hypothetical protein